MIRAIVNFFKKGRATALSTHSLDLLSRPEVAIHMGEGNAGKKLLRAWIPWFEKRAIPFCIITRTQTVHEYCQKHFPHICAVRAASPQHVEYVLDLLPSLDTIFYLSTTVNNVHLLRFNHLKHVFIGTGKSFDIKENGNVLRVFDELWLPDKEHEAALYAEGFTESDFCIKTIDASQLNTYFHNLADKKLHRAALKPAVLSLFSREKRAHGKESKTITLALHSGEGETEKFHLDMWAPLFAASGKQFCILVRNKNLFHYCRERYKDIPCLYVRGPNIAAAVKRSFPNLTTIFYLSNTGNNTHLLALVQLRHIFLGHGDSDKASSAHKFFRAYDEVWVSGQAHIDRLHNANFDLRNLRFRITGNPALKNTLQESAARPWAERFTPPKVLYLPTWEGGIAGHGYSSLAKGRELLDSLVQKHSCHVAVKPHPLTGTRDEKFSDYKKQLQMNKNLHVYSEHVLARTTITQANIYICDISAVISECLTTQAPIFLYMPHTHISLSSSKFPLSEFCYLFSCTEELMDKFTSVITGNDSLRLKRQQALEYFVGKQETLDDVFFQALESRACSKVGKACL